jgi:hypothetical protein
MFDALKSQQLQQDKLSIEALEKDADAVPDLVRRRILVDRARELLLDIEAMEPTTSPR